MENLEMEPVRLSSTYEIKMSCLTMLMPITRFVIDIYFAFAVFSQNLKVSFSNDVSLMVGTNIC